ncbi:MAG: 50S ribosomal protein L7ae [Lachnospiraceae bacterium]|nr:50S ribosomal protein L7ae [Lachnospiraceae bacterium]
MRYTRICKRSSQATMHNKILSMLGLAMKARKLASGEFQTETAVKSGKACLVIVSSDAKDGTKKKYRDMCAFYKVPIAEYGEMEALGHAIGKADRSGLAVTDEGFAKGLMKLLGLPEGIGTEEQEWQK